MRKLQTITFSIVTTDINEGVDISAPALCLDDAIEDFKYKIAEMRSCDGELVEVQLRAVAIMKRDMIQRVK